MLGNPRDNREALAAFLAKKAEIDTALARHATQLRRITDAAVKEGEHAE